MAKRIDVDAEIDGVRLKDQAGDPATPAAGYKQLYVKADGLYLVDESDTVVGPLIPETTNIITIEQNIEFSAVLADPAPEAGKGKNYVKDKDLYFIDPDGVVYQITAPRMLVFTQEKALVPKNGQLRLYNYLGNPYAIQNVLLSVGVAPTGANLIVDVNKNGASIFNTLPTIVAGANTGSSNDFSDSDFGINDYLTVDIDQVGSTVAGEDLTVHIVVKQNG